MSQRHYLLNTDVPTSDLMALRLAGREQGKTIVECAEGVYTVPLPWIACFTVDDLQPCRVPMESGDPVTLQIPCTTVQAALGNLREALPLFEHLTGEQALAREYWEAAIAGLEKLPLPYLTMDLSEMLYTSTAEDLNEDLLASLGRTPAAVDHFRDTMVAYTPGVLPYHLEEFLANEGIDDEDRIMNTRAVDAAIVEDGFVRSEL